MIHVASFSTGLSSALMTVRLLERFGRDSVKIVFTDTLMEDEDNYRFMEDFESYFGVEVIKITAGLTPYQLMEKTNMIFNSKIAKCPFVLKRDVFMNYLKTLEGEVTIHIGYDYKETHRCEPTKKYYEKYGYKVDFPLLWEPIIKEDYKELFIREYGIIPPRFYYLNYSHANCSGICVKQGGGDWLLTLIYFPERYKQIEEWEQRMIEKIGKRQTIISISTRDGNRIFGTYYTLREFRELYERGELKKNLRHFLTQNCIKCSIGDFSDSKED